MSHTTYEMTRLGDSGEHHEVIVVGGGQAGLAIGYFLAEQGREFTILEAAEQPATAWRERWGSDLERRSRFTSPGQPDHRL